MAIALGINGAAGRMGQRLVALTTAAEDLELVAAVEHRQHPQLGEDAGLIAGVGQLGLALCDKLPTTADAIIDFSVPAASVEIAASCQQAGIPLVLATTGLDEEQTQAVQQAAESIAVVWAPNMSLAVNLTMKLATLAGEKLQGVAGGVDVEIIERHHRFKEDAPSGTALRFGELISEVMGQTEHVHGREGIIGQRSQQEIGYHSLRVGDNPGEHTIVFSVLGETIELTVRATDRDCYALGALQAARFVTTQPAGLYTMDDLLGL